MAERVYITSPEDERREHFHRLDDIDESLRGLHERIERLENHYGATPEIQHLEEKLDELEEAIEEAAEGDELDEHAEGDVKVEEVVETKPEPPKSSKEESEPERHESRGRHPLHR